MGFCGEGESVFDEGDFAVLEGVECAYDFDFAFFFEVGEDFAALADVGDGEADVFVDDGFDEVFVFGVFLVVCEAFYGVDGGLDFIEEGGEVAGDAADEDVADAFVKDLLDGDAGVDTGEDVGFGVLAFCAHGDAGGDVRICDFPGDVAGVSIHEVFEDGFWGECFLFFSGGLEFFRMEGEACYGCECEAGE